MKITVSCSYGTPRIVQLSSQLDRRGYLHRLYVPYYQRKFPYSFLRKVLGGDEFKEIDVDVNKVNTNLGYTVISGLIKRYGPLTNLFRSDGTFILGEIADRSVSKRLDGASDIVIAESNLALHTIRKAKKLGIVSVVDRPGIHIDPHLKAYKEEYKKFGQKYVIDSRVVEKGMKEYQEADYIFVLSSFAKRTFLGKKIPESKLILIPSGVDLATFKQINKNDDVFRIIYCGGTSLSKGVHYLLKAFSELKLKNTELWLIGPVFKDIKPFLAKYERSYNLIEWVPHHLLYKYLSQGSVFVCPSLVEGMPKVIIEAMACGLPVIATTHTGVEDVIRDGVDGFIIPIRNVEAIKEKITYMYENVNVCKKMGQNAKKRVRENFTLEHYANRVIHACKKILKQG